MTATKEPMRLDLKAPHQKYFAKDGKQVCGVTSLLDSLAKPLLYDWYPRVEREGVLAGMRRILRLFTDSRASSKDQPPGLRYTGVCNELSHRGGIPSRHRTSAL